MSAFRRLRRRNSKSWRRGRRDADPAPVSSWTSQAWDKLAFACASGTGSVPRVGPRVPVAWGMPGAPRGPAAGLAGSRRTRGRFWRGVGADPGPELGLGTHGGRRPGTGVGRSPPAPSGPLSPSPSPSAPPAPAPDWLRDFRGARCLVSPGEGQGSWVRGQRQGGEGQVFERNWGEGSVRWIPWEERGSRGAEGILKRVTDAPRHLS